MLDTNLATAVRAKHVAMVTMALAAVFALGACSDTSQKDVTGPTISQTVTNGDDEGDDNAVYEQVEFLGNPLVSEVTIVKANHDAYNRTQPYNTAEFGPQSLAFINAFRGSQPVVANTLGAVLYRCAPIMFPQTTRHSAHRSPIWLQRLSDSAMAPASVLHRSAAIGVTAIAVALTVAVVQLERRDGAGAGS